MSEIDEALLEHRSNLEDVAFIAVTGSRGKSTTAHLIGELLRVNLNGVVSTPDSNCGSPLVSNILSVSKGLDFCVQELGAWGPGTLDAGLAVVRPTIGVVLNVGRDHYSAFGSLDETAAEKSAVVRVLPSSGVAILCADDHRVAAMASCTPARVLTVGRSAHADLRADDVSAQWPGTLSFRLTYRGRHRHVRTRLLAEHSVGSALAALASVVALDQSLDAAVEALAHVEPVPRRMSWVSLSDGVDFVRDDFKSPSDSMSEAIDFLARAKATRTWAVIGTISDYPGRSRPIYSAIALQAAAAVDEVVFVGERASSLWGDRAQPWADVAHVSQCQASVRVFETVKEASRVINAELSAGDLVLLKGSGPADHLERILLDRTTSVGCWRLSCGRVNSCDDCELLAVSEGSR